MDALRGLAVLAVIVFHAGTLLRYADLEVPEGLRIFNRAVAPFRIPMLVLLSGMLLPRSVAKGASRYLQGKAQSIAWPYLLWSGVIGIIMWSQYGLPSVKWLAPNVLIGGSYLWYLFFLLLFYTAALPLKRLPRLPVAAVFMLLAELAPDDTKYAERLAFLFALFLVGWYVADHPAGLHRNLSSHWLPVAALTVVTVSYVFGDMSGYGPRAALGTLAGVYLFAAVGVRLSNLPAFRPLRFIGRNSVVYYCIHFPLIVGLMTLAKLFKVDQAYLLVGSGALVAIGLATFLSIHRQTSPFTAGLFVAPAWTRRWGDR